MSDISIPISKMEYAIQRLVELEDERDSIECEMSNLKFKMEVLELKNEVLVDVITRVSDLVDIYTRQANNEGYDSEYLMRRAREMRRNARR